MSTREFSARSLHDESYHRGSEEQEDPTIWARLLRQRGRQLALGYHGLVQLQRSEQLWREQLRACQQLCRRGSEEPISWSEKELPGVQPNERAWQGGLQVCQGWARLGEGEAGI
ncbi:unnamed protein product [Nesidiocoris tenuis]|uniref:Uncharacterized protein n=1 Tax=Nesidiocoris tenuis TaxID=355587 RepID=A0A6H5HNC9_9HEMI|nr:unnamed protein product [Nesidiocoris tenuis]